ncbi:DUF1850 domain-containing protein [Bacillus sp. B15-48]|uniref:DUF1850 domain-containing protein n=1 Tax=Bacillus sp. B15-48 TaxID=1548601 RepID=UPI00193EF920|nr:DUF1850 domain-containing protein [Bacillus sp. B15-48]MBM4764277.1 DUF1850 domain-containing protein [Bacillus sp. B15-48]
MKLSRKGKDIFVLFSLSAIVIIISLFIPYKQALVFLQIENNYDLSYLPIKKGETFKIEYVHSIHLSNVIESYKVINEYEFRQYELEYEDYAIGMPSDAAGDGDFVAGNGKYYIKNTKRDFTSFLLRTGQVRANHTLIYQNQFYPLSDFIEPGTRVSIQLKKLSVIQQLKGVNILGDK